MSLNERFGINLSSCIKSDTGFWKVTVPNMKFLVFIPNKVSTKS